MQPRPCQIRIMLVVVMNRWLKVSRGLLVALLLIVGAGCGGPDVADPVSAAESLVDAPSAQTAASAESNSLGFQESGEFSVFPAFMPPVAFGGDTEECQLSSDPYSTCI